eukprot:c17311_g1_i2 orf=122-1213(+)
MVLHIKKVLKVRARRIFGFVKDRVAIGQVKLRGDQQHTALQVSVIRATSHSEVPPSDELVHLILQGGSGSRMRVSHCINLLMERLNKTKSWIVALKCLTLIHKAVRSGSFIYQDQLSFHPTNGGKNYLKLSQFRDKSSPLAWKASSWIRWYANFLEALMEASRCLGRFLDSHSKLFSTEKVVALQNSGLMTVILSLNTVLGEFCNCPLKSDVAMSNILIRDALQLVVMDCITTQGELRIHIKEICQRLNALTVSQISELLRVCETLIAQSSSLAQLTNLAFAMNLLRSTQCLEGIALTDYELMHIKAALKASQNSNQVVVTTTPARKDFSNGSLLSFKLSPPSNWKSSKVSLRRPQLAAISSS